MGWPLKLTGLRLSAKTGRVVSVNCGLLISWRLRSAAGEYRAEHSPALARAILEAVGLDARAVFLGELRA
ncbi:hypothetical protein J2W14_002499 [Pseudarthrobacter oxydans]|nr:hypothetical protein [Pseudarthrobacter oxydans]